MYIRSVSKHVAINPIARAIARQKLKNTLVDKKIRLYVLEDGEECFDVIDGLNRTLSLIIDAATIDMSERFSGLGSKVRSMREGQEACVKILETGKYDLEKTNVICEALDVAEETNAKIHPQSIQKAVQRCQDLAPLLQPQ